MISLWISFAEKQGSPTGNGSWLLGKLAGMKFARLIIPPSNALVLLVSKDRTGKDAPNFSPIFEGTALLNASLVGDKGFGLWEDSFDEFSSVVFPLGDRLSCALRSGRPLCISGCQYAPIALPAELARIFGQTQVIRSVLTRLFFWLLTIHVHLRNGQASLSDAIQIQLTPKWFLILHPRKEGRQNSFPKTSGIVNPKCSATWQPRNDFRELIIMACYFEHLMQSLRELRHPRFGLFQRDMIHCFYDICESEALLHNDS